MALTRPTAAQINTVVTTITDSLTVLNQGSTAANIDIGFILNRSPSANVAMVWQASSNQFIFANTSSSGITNANITVNNYANLRAGNLITTSVTYANGQSILTNVESAITTANTNLKGYTDNLVTTANTNLKGYTDGQISTTTTAITTANTNLKGYTDNLVTTANTNLKGYVDAANTIQSNQVAGANSAITTANTNLKGYTDNLVTAANTNLKGYVDGQISTTTTAITTANTNLKGYTDNLVTTANTNLKGYVDAANTIQSNQIAGANSAITTANTNLKGYVDNLVTTANTNLKGYTDGQISTTTTAITTANTNLKGYTDNLVTTANTNLKGYVDAANTIQSNQVAGANSAITTANTNMKGYVDGQISTTTTAITTANTNLKGYTDNLVTTANTNLKGYTDGQISTTTTAITTANTNMKGYVDAANTIQSNQIDWANASISAANTAITTANTNMKGYVDGQISTTTTAITTANTNMKGYVDGQISTRAALSGATFTGAVNTTELFVTSRSGDEGGQLNLANAVTNTTLVGNVVIDVFQNRLRIFEGGGTNRGGYFDLSGLATSVGTNLAAGGGGGTPGGGDTQMQFNDASTFGGALSLRYFKGNGVVLANAGVASTSTTTGALQVVGGVGVGGNVFAGGSISVSGTATFAAGTQGAPSISRTGDTNTGIFFPAADQISVTTGGQHRFSITSSGALFGSEFASPNGALAVYGAFNQTGGEAKLNSSYAGIWVLNNGTSGGISNYVDVVNGGFFSWSTVDTLNGGPGQEYMSLTSTGLDLQLGVLKVTTGSVGAPTITNRGDTNTGIFFPAEDTIAFTEGGVESMRINSSGNVGIGNTNPLHTLSVNGSTNITGNITAGNITAGGVRQTISTSAPATKMTGDQWYDTATDTLFQFVYDGTGYVWVDISGQPLNVNIGTVQGTSLSISGNGSLTGALTLNSSNGVTALINGGTNGAGNIGASGASFNTIFAKASSAQYADLAEKYIADVDYAPGTVLIFGGAYEVTISSISHDTRVAGVITTNPAFIMNETLEDSVTVALTGRVPCRVLGPINKGDRLVSSQHPGVAQCLIPALYEPGCIIGKSLETIDTNEIKLIEIAIGRF